MGTLQGKLVMGHLMSYYCMLLPFSSHFKLIYLPLKNAVHTVESLCDSIREEAAEDVASQAFI